MRILALIGFVATLGFCACGDEATVPDSVLTQDVEVPEFRQLIETGDGLLLDVRTPDEFSAGHIEGALNIDYLGPDFATKVEELDKAQPIYVYCQSGGRSGKAMTDMSSMGFTSIYNLEGGYSAWVNQ